MSNALESEAQERNVLNIDSFLRNGNENHLHDEINDGPYFPSTTPVHHFSQDAS